MNIMVMGDVHAEWGFLRSVLMGQEADIMLVCGDFGYWPQKEFGFWPPRLDDCYSKVYWCPGNHEHWWELQRLYGRHGDEPIEVEKNIFYCPIGSTLELPDGRVVLFVGGAESIDKAYRTLGHDWFPDEVLTQSDLDHLPDKKVDIVVSHTCPTDFNVDELGMRAIPKAKDPTRHALSAVLDMYSPKLWYFGHYHHYGEGYTKNCKWYALPCEGRMRWFRDLD